MDASTASASAAPLPYDYSIAFEIARTVVVSNTHLAAAAGASVGDLAHDLAVEMWRAHQNFDPSKSKYVTWGGRVAHLRLISRARSGGRLEAREEKHRSFEENRRAGTQVGFCARALDAGPEIVLRISRKLSAYCRGRLGHPPQAYVKAMTYREERGLSWWGLRRALVSDAWLVKELGFKSAPARSSLVDSQRRLRAWAKRRPL